MKKHTREILDKNFKGNRKDHSLRFFFFVTIVKIELKKKSKTALTRRSINVIKKFQNKRNIQFDK